MVRNCAVPNCANEPECSLFTVPKENELRNQWSEILKCNLGIKSYVCEKHFKKDDILSKYYAESSTGQVLLDVPFKRKRLKKGTVPIHKNCYVDNVTQEYEQDKEYNAFGNSEDFVLKEVSVHDFNKGASLTMPRVQSSTDKLFNNGNAEFVKTHCSNQLQEQKQLTSIFENLDDGATYSKENSQNNTLTKDVYAAEECRETVNMSKKRNFDTENGSTSDKDNHKNTNDSAQKMQQAQASSSSVICDLSTVPNKKQTSNITSDSQTCDHEAKYLEFIEKLYNEEQSDNFTVNLPNKRWTFQKLHRSKSLVFYWADTEIIERSSLQFELITYTKMIKFGTKDTNSTEKLQLFVNNRLLEKSNNLFPKVKPTDVDQLEQMLQDIDSYKICVGGPPSNTYKIVNSRSATKDGNTWRHNNCEVLLKNGSICRKCAQLHKLLGRALDRCFKKITIRKKREREEN